MPGLLEALRQDAINDLRAKERLANLYYVLNDWGVATSDRNSMGESLLRFHSVMDNPVKLNLDDKRLETLKKMNEDFTSLEQGNVKVFVYGTLKRGHCRENLLNGQTFLGEVETVDEYCLWDCGRYPGMTWEPADGYSVKGELWEVDRRCLDYLDHIEGVEHELYLRSEIQLKNSPVNGKVIGYLYNQPVQGLRSCGPSWEKD